MATGALTAKGFITPVRLRFLARGARGTKHAKGVLVRARSLRFLAKAAREIKHAKGFL
jgi:hypothetical protein